jgi:membrane protease YdiL (CAAX protease family)
MFGYEEPGVGQGMLARRIIPTKKTTLGGVLIAFLPLLIFPVAFFLFYFIYKPNTEPFVINWYVLLFPIIGAFSVELGWRGYFLNKAGSTMHIFLATIFTGILWFLSNAYLYINDVFLGITYMFLSVIINIILTYLYFIFNRNILLTYFFQLAYTYMYTTIRNFKN